MTKILFVCHGNICRSPMAEFVFKDLVKNKKCDSAFFIDSAATSSEELGNEMHIGTRRKLTKENVPYTSHSARKLTLSDYNKYDYIIGMDENNIRNMMRIFGEDRESKIYRLLDFSNYSRDIADPWYTGDFNATYDDVVEGCNGLWEFLVKNKEAVKKL